MKSDCDKEDNPLREALANLGMTKAADSYIFKTNGEDEEDEGPIARTIALLLGVLQISMTHTYSVYDRTAMRHEFNMLLSKFRESQDADSPEATELVEQICSAYGDAASFVNTRARDLGEHDVHAALFNIEGVADCAAATLLVYMSLESMEKIKNDDIPEKMIDAVVAGMRRAYIIDLSEELENTFRFHARNKLRSTASKMYNKRRTKET